MNIEVKSFVFNIHASMPWYIPTNAMRSTDVVVMLGQCRRQWPNIKTTLDQRVVFDGSSTRWSA